MRFQDGFEKEMSMNQLTIVTVERRPITKEYEVPEIYAMPEEEVDLEKWYYNDIYIYVLLKFNKENDVNIKEYHIEIEVDMNK